MNFPIHFHSSFEMLYMESGEIEITVGNSVYKPSAGDIALILPDVPHAYKTETKSITHITIFRSDYITEVCDEQKAGIYRSPILRGQNALFESMKNGESDTCLYRAHLYLLAAEYFKNPIIPAAREETQDFSRAFSEYIAAHYSEPLNEQRVAKALGYHPRYLSHLIRKNFKAGFRTVLNEYRIKNACRLLSSGNSNITEIYLAVGFESQCAFNRNFKAIMGVTPSKYRKGQ